MCEMQSVTFKQNHIMWKYLKNEFDFRKVHGIMNTSRLLQRQETRSFTLQETRSIHDSSKLCKRTEVFMIQVNFARDPKYS